MSSHLVCADGQLVRQLGQLRTGTEELTQSRADMMLTRVVWARITEPGDGLAGELIAAEGAQDALELVLQNASAARLRAALEKVRETSGNLITERALRDACERWRSRANRAETVRDIERAVASGVRVLCPGDEHWPDRVNDLGANAPTVLWVRGDWRALNARALGVVGARAATGYGSHVTAELVDGACAAGFAIVSGAAYGIDAVAHRTALAAGGVTLAVLAGGVDRPYPRAHDGLLREISRIGVVCSEMIPGSAPTRWRFLQRNRLIAALSEAVLVTEAGVHSGSLNTAGHAAQLSRPIGAVPGPITSAASAGCHRLVRDYDATLITSVDDVYELLAVDREFVLFGEAFGEAKVAAGADGNASGEADGETVDVGAARDESGEPRLAGREGSWGRRVIDAIPLQGFRTLAGIAQFSGLSEYQVRGVLAELELLGKVRGREVAEEGEHEWALMK